MPRIRGVRISASSTLLGRLPSITRCGTTCSAVPSAPPPPRSCRTRAPAPGRTRWTRGCRGGPRAGSASPNPIRSTGIKWSPGGSAGRSCAGRWCQARPSRPPRCRKTPAPGQRDVLAVGLHRELLQVGGEALQVLLVRHHAVGLRSRRSRGTRAPAGPSAPAGSARAGRCGSARPSRGIRPASRRSARARSRPSWTGRWPIPSSTGRLPSPRSRTCWPYRCRTRPPAPRWWTPRRNAWPRRPRSPARRRSSHAPRWRWSASPAC